MLGTTQPHEAQHGVTTSKGATQLIVMSVTMIKEECHKSSCGFICLTPTFGKFKATYDPIAR